jgi:tRNA pseudouridine55 synthase
MTDGSQRSWDFREGGEVLFIDKPLEWTSYQVVRKVRSLFDVRKVGHAGTLDPKATGLLILCTGKRTRELDRYMGLEKEYVGTMELGIRTPSFDLETEVSERRSLEGISQARIEDAAKTLTGTIHQEPPMYSAVKHAGTPLYRYARRGEVVERKTREVMVDRFEIEQIDIPVARFRIVCSKGTYVRSLVDELGQRLGCGATLTSLRRVRIGPHRVEEAWSMDRLTELSGSLGLERRRKHADHTPA